MTKLLLLIFGGLKLGKVLMSAGTMLASIAVYALFYGWRFAAGFVALLLVHEAGHHSRARAPTSGCRPSSRSSARGSS